MQHAVIDGRSLISLAGPDASELLQNTVTCEIETLQNSELRPGALLTPQGKIIADFLVGLSDDGFILDCASTVAPFLHRRLTMYKLRADAEISVSDQEFVTISWDIDSDSSEIESGYIDRRFARELPVIRRYEQNGGEAKNTKAWDMLRIKHGVAECGIDFSTETTFPHDVMMDFNKGVSFSKGCFVGQEVVSRMQHRGTARRRIMIASGLADRTEKGAAITAGGREIGTLGTVVEGSGLALVRIDRASDAVREGIPLFVDGKEICLSIPSGVDLQFPIQMQSGGDS